MIEILYCCGGTFNSRKMSVRGVIVYLLLQSIKFCHMNCRKGLTYQTAVTADIINNLAAVAATKEGMLDIEMSITNPPSISKDQF